MGTRATKHKMRYNRDNYRRFEFNIRTDTKLLAILERHKELGGNISALIKTALCEHFGLSEEEADAIFVEYHITQSGGARRNPGIDRFFESASTNEEQRKNRE